MALRNPSKNTLAEHGFYELNLLTLKCYALLLTYKTDFYFICNSMEQSLEISTLLSVQCMNSYMKCSVGKVSWRKEKN